jgi:cadmium resistance protein CadD (predicted permease)
MDLFGLIAIGIGALVATNIDDTFILIILFSTVTFQARHVFIGQFLGTTFLIVVTALGSLIALVVPPFIIGLLGLAPIGIGIHRLIELRRTEESEIKNNKTRQFNKKSKSYLPFFTVAAITVANGGDDIGVFTPLFAKYNDAGEVTLLVTIFMAMTLLWCIVTYYFVNHPNVANRIKRPAKLITPFVLIGLGVYTLVDSFILWSNFTSS